MANKATPSNNANMIMGSRPTLRSDPTLPEPEFIHSKNLNYVFFNAISCTEYMSSQFPLFLEFGRMIRPNQKIVQYRELIAINPVSINFQKITLKSI
jgi:hypothetical protein